MEINEDLVRRFFSKECTPDEADFVASFLQENPQFLDAYFGQHELDAIEPQTAANADTMDEWEALQLKIKGRRRGRNFAMLLAACLVGILLTGVLFLSNNKNTNQQANAEKPIFNEPGDGRTVIANHTDTIQQIVLADGSKIRLSSGATIKYSSEVWQSKRDIELEGEATFYVAKNKEKPFTVFCKEVSVRALGTVFSVRQNNGADSIRVRLFEGKVLVRKQKESRGKDSADLIKPITLIPGQEVLFGTGQNDGIVRSFINIKPQNTVANKKVKTDNGFQKPTGWIEFTDQPLADLFTSLEVLYNVEINYKHKDVQGIFFVGRFEPYDTIDGILDIIAKLNGLTIEKMANGRYLVKK